MGHEEEDDDSGEVVTLTDDDGNEVTFEMLAIVEVDGQDYALLTPVDLDDEGEEGIDIHIFRYKETEDGTEFDDDLDEATFEKVQAAADELFAELEKEAGEA